MPQLPTKYNPKDMEDRIYRAWEKRGYFHVEPDKNKLPFTIVIPPPNVTGQLHMGHALDNTLQDIIIRFKRMQGYNTLWQPGSDHASIATEVKVTEQLKSEGIDKRTLGREGFLKRAWQWKEEYGGRIISQLKKLGSSCDWERERFTMDEQCSKAVTEAFVRMYEKGLIYKGSKLINWCPVCKTTISDAEVEYVDMPGYLWHIKYYLVKDLGNCPKTPIAADSARENADCGNFVNQAASDFHTADEFSDSVSYMTPDSCVTDFLVCATTRPETMLGDTAVAVNPNDARYKDFIGKKVMLPLMNRVIPVIADEYVDMEFGTGVVKVTPAHDPNDFQIGLRHNLPQINVLDDAGYVNENGGKFSGMERYAARTAIVNELESLGLLQSAKNHDHSVGTHDRCGTVIEPLIKEQWFVRMEDLIKPAAAAVRNGDIKLVPPNMDRLYFQWTDNIRDWCISRQLWWGHRIPAYYCGNCGKMIISRKTPSICPVCAQTVFAQDEDVLDTWFSSALWPFSTLGWPDETKDLEYFFPTSVLVTGYDIIFFWVIRMVFSSYEQMRTYPFKSVLFHGLVRDEQGRKMSKSLGNGIDPLDIIDKYGADALRLTLVTGNTPGNDMRFSDAKIEYSRNFANKLWNAARFFLMHAGQQDFDYSLTDSITQSGVSAAQELCVFVKRPGQLPENREILKLCLEDRYILSSVNRLVADVTGQMERFELGIASAKICDFIWDELCDWYIEMIKPRLYGNSPQDKAAAIAVLRDVINIALKLLHPFMPFITEEIFTTIFPDDGFIMVSSYPAFNPGFIDNEAERQIESIKDVIRQIRAARLAAGLSQSSKHPVYLVSADESVRSVFMQAKNYFNSLCGASELSIRADETGIPEDAVAIVSGNVKIFLPFVKTLDPEDQMRRFLTEKERLESELVRVNKLLSNPGFISKAPASKIELEQAKKKKFESMLEEVLIHINRHKPH